MASVTSNMDLEILANITLGALVPKLDELSAFATGVDAEAQEEGDNVKVEVHGITKDAAAYNKSSNNYEDVGADTTTGVNITLDQKIKKTAEVEEKDQGRVDISEKLKGLGAAVAYKFTLDIYNTLIAATYTNTEEVVGAASGFTYDDIVDLEVVADDAEFVEGQRFCLLNNTYTANLKKDGVLVANKAADVDPKRVWQRYEEIANFKVAGSSVIKNVSGTASTENLIGFITDKTAIGIGFGAPRVASNADYEVVNVTDPKTGLVMQFRRHIQRATGSMFLNAVILGGYSQLRDGSLTRLVSS